MSAPAAAPSNDVPLDVSLSRRAFWRQRHEYLESVRAQLEQFLRANPKEWTTRRLIKKLNLAEDAHTVGSLLNNMPSVVRTNPESKYVALWAHRNYVKNAPPHRSVSSSTHQPQASGDVA